ncbi:hypothetical protein ACFPIF_15155 [Brevundimonas faecalis]|uniref:hypothetical protein n=1 Tax=Brevundimonas faecalis TaxID=947378 RepID=UPI0036097B10
MMNIVVLCFDSRDQRMEVFQNRSSAMSGAITSGATSIILLSHTSAGDDGGGVYRLVGANPGHAASFQNTPSGTWWELADAVATPQQFGARGDGVTDDTVAIQGVISAWPAVAFPARTYATRAPIQVPTTCLTIDAAGATLVGPGKAAGIDGIVFSGFHQGSDAGLMDGVKGQGYRLPALVGYRRALYIRNSAWLVIELDLIKDSGAGVFVEATADQPAQDRRFCVQNRVFVSSMIRSCDAAFDLSCTRLSTEGIQGNWFGTTYVSACRTAIRGVFDSPDTNYFFNEFYIQNLDRNGTGTGAKCIDFNILLNSSKNKYAFVLDPINFTGTGDDFVNVPAGQIIDNGYFESNSFEAYHWPSFLPGGDRTTTRPGDGTLAIYVDPSASIGGHGSSASPYNTIARAVSEIQQLDGFGNTVVIRLATAEYSERVSIDGRYQNLGNMRLILTSATGRPQDVVLKGGVELRGPIFVLFERLTFGCQTRAALQANDGATAQLVLHRFINSAGQFHVAAFNGGVVEHHTSYEIAGGALAHACSRFGGRLRWLGGTVTLIGAPVFGNFVDVQDSGSAAMFNGIGFSGSAVGQRYSVAVNGSISTNGAGASYLPGSTPGAAGLGGVYY